MPKNFANRGIKLSQFGDKFVIFNPLSNPAGGLVIRIIAKLVNLRKSPSRPGCRNVALLLLLLLGGAVHGGDRIPAAAFAAAPDFRQPALSPSGDWIAALRRDDVSGQSGTALVLLSFDDLKEEVLFRQNNAVMHMNWLHWLNDDQLLVSAVSPARRGAEERKESSLYVVERKTGSFRSLLPEGFWRNKDWVPVVQDRVVDYLPGDDENILLALSTRLPGSKAVYKVNVNDGSIKTLQRERGGVVDWITDRQQRLRIGVEVDGDEYRILFRAPQSRRWGPLWSFNAFSIDQVWPLGFDKDPDILYVNAYHEGRKAIFKINLAHYPLRMQLVFADPLFDVIGSLIYSEQSGEVIGTTYTTNGGYTFWKWAFLGLQQAINRTLRDTNNIVYSFSEDERRYIVLATSDTDAGTFYIGDRDSQRIKPFAFRYENLDPGMMAKTEITQYTARDGLSIQAFLTLPQDEKQRPLPAIIFPHGGPMSYDNGGFNHWAQFFANRGYAVLQMNYRGSAGYGFDFLQAGLKGWGRDMQNDVEDGTRWLIEQGIAEAGNICIVGSSYGGYAALMEAAKGINLYSCAVSFAGVSDLEYLLNTSKGFRNYDRVAKQIGDDKKELRAFSPALHAEAFNIPVLIIHGKNDQQVPVEHGRRMFNALQKAGKPVIYVEQELGDHFLSRLEDRLEVFQRMDKFLGENLR